MKLESDMLMNTLDQFEAEALPDSHPAIPQLNETFGEHTFLLDEEGLHIIEPAEDATAGDLVGTVVTVGRWTSDGKSLALQQPEPSDIRIDLGSGGPRSAA
jgi:hypothetical protein